MTPALATDSLRVTFEDFVALDDVSLAVAPGESFGLVGESGSGKSTLLRAVAGLAPVSGGTIEVDGQRLGGKRSKAFYRQVQMVFQDPYGSLHPRQTVDRLLLEPLAIHGFDDTERRIVRALDEVGLGAGFRFRYSHQLSGGQRQRVAIARALAVEPGVLLLDEPLSALDLKLRQHMRAELRALQKRTGVTFIYITHDQSEALAMSDRVAVMSAGLLQQVATPRELYDNPATAFVARFVGETNAISGRISDVQDGRARIDTALGILTGRAGQGARTGAQGTIYIRPEALMPGDPVNALDARIERVDFEGAFALVHGRFADGAALAASVPSTRLADAPAPGAEARFGFAPDHAVVLADA